MTTTTKSPTVTAATQSQRTTETRGPGTVQTGPDVRAMILDGLSNREKSAMNNVLRSGAAQPFADVIAAYETAYARSIG